MNRNVSKWTFEEKSAWDATLCLGHIDLYLLKDMLDEQAKGKITARVKAKEMCDKRTDVWSF